MKNTRIKMNVSIAGTLEGRDIGFQVGDVVDIPGDLAKKWIKAGHCSEVPSLTPLTQRDLNLADLDAEQLLRYACVYCSPSHARGAVAVYEGSPVCEQHFRAIRELKP